MVAQTENNKRIAKNTVYLYIRQFLVMGVGLYTSRVVLDTLGETDFGIYNVVGGIVTFFTFINFAMSCATNRFITFALGKDDKELLNKTFTNSIFVHIAIALIILLLGETIGLYFFYNKMNIPPERMYAASWVYQLSIFTCMVNILSIPYNALITSHEKMNAYAAISIIEVTFKLIIVYLLLIISCDHLILYAILVFIVGVFIRLLNQLYCRKSFYNVVFIHKIDKKIMKDMFAYASWSLIGSMGVIFANQGQNILLNMTFGPIVNAARGISTQIQNAVGTLSNNFYGAISPQINKSYAGGNIDYMHMLIYNSTRYMFFLLLILALPVILNIEYILNLWLTKVPKYTSSFVILMIMISILSSLGNPLSSAIGATGKIRLFQLTEGLLQVLLLPITWLFFQFYKIPEIAFYIQIVICCFAQIIRLLIVRKQLFFSIKKYIIKCIFPSLYVLLCSLPFPLFFKYYSSSSFLSLVGSIIISEVSIILAIYFTGISKNERKLVNNKVNNIFNNRLWLK